MFAKNADLVNIFSSNSILKKHSGKNLWNYFDVSETYGSGYPLILITKILETLDILLTL